jgi:hypothetical protein
MPLAASVSIQTPITVPEIKVQRPKAVPATAPENASTSAKPPASATASGEPAAPSKSVGKATESSTASADEFGGRQ